MSIVKYAKRSVSIPADLAAALDQQAADQGTTVSALLARAAAREVYVRRGLDAVEHWKRETGTAFGEEEIASVEALLDAAGVGTIHQATGTSTTAASTRPASGKTTTSAKTMTSAKKAAAKSSKVLRDGRVSSAVAKSSKVLRDGRVSSAVAKSAASSALSQRQPTSRRTRTRSK
jgi:hypothetical protein